MLMLMSMLMLMLLLQVMLEEMEEHPYNYTLNLIDVDVDVDVYAGIVGGDGGAPVQPHTQLHHQHSQLSSCFLHSIYQVNSCLKGSLQ